MISFLILCLLLPDCARATDEINGWKDKPRRALIEHYSRTGQEKIEQLVDRSYYYTDGKLDSVVDVDQDSKSVYSKFMHVPGHVNVVPWDRSLSAMQTTWWKRDTDGNLQLASITSDSVHPRFHEIVDHSVYKRDSDGNVSLDTRETSQFDEKGYLIGSRLYMSYFQTASRTEYAFDEQGRILRLIRIDSDGMHPTSTRSGLDTVEQSYFQYNGDDDKPHSLSLLKMLDFMGTREATVLQWGDSVVNFPFLSVHSLETFFIPRRYVLRAEIRDDGGKPQIFSAAIDDRHRLIRAGYSDSNVTTALYYDDNEVKQAESIVKGTRTFGIKNLRTFDKSGRVLTQETQSLFSSRKEGTYRLKERITYEY